MASGRSRVGKTEGWDLELSQLLKLVLAKLVDEEGCESSGSESEKEEARVLGYSPDSQGPPSADPQGACAMLADIRRSLMALSSVPPGGMACQFQANSSPSIAAVPAQAPHTPPIVPMAPVQLSSSAQGQPSDSYDSTAQALLSVAQLLSKLNVPPNPVPPTTPHGCLLMP
ncbi:hypothetical protein NDU88_001142 [Pleurodeles waltl]|uniref:Uncharacterized protein n=1 Tax=Pleurodeles waltl TaxID=8319 RepID=A0AAV7VAH6_PLEWA|nr:hypothetical protein NDU88_001142 [Pleurodeles waltl]